MEPVEEFLRDVEVLLALENSDFAAATQLVEELKDKVTFKKISAQVLIIIECSTP